MRRVGSFVVDRNGMDSRGKLFKARVDIGGGAWGISAASGIMDSEVSELTELVSRALIDRFLSDIPVLGVVEESDEFMAFTGAASGVERLET